MGLVLFCNTLEEVCGVHQYGRCLFECIKHSQKHRFEYAVPRNREHLDTMIWSETPEAIIYNWHPLIGGFLSDGRPDLQCKQVIVFHDQWGKEEQFDAIIMSDPTQTNRGKWHFIGRPLPKWKVVPKEPEEPITFGLHGFNGAWSIYMVNTIASCFDRARIRLHLPASPFIDPEGDTARRIAQDCQNQIRGNPGITMEIHHTFLREMSHLMGWLSQNDMNVYIRDVIPWVGVSSATDAALAVGRPLAINNCPAFRHLFDAKPTIKVEDRSLEEIFLSGTKPLKPFLKQWSPEKITEQVEEVIDAIL